jgi:large subunit ribosomal protein L25
MGIQELSVTTRTTTGKGEAGRLRRSGFIPGVVYGLGMDSISVAVSPKAIGHILHSEKGLNSVVLLREEQGDRSRHVMIKALDRHPVTDRLTHVDFIRLDMEKPIRAIVPLHVVGTPQGVKLGGILTIVRHELEVEALPADIPSSIEADVSGLAMDEALRIGSLPEITGVRFVLGPTRTLAVVHLPDTEIEKGEKAEGEE